MSISNVQRTSKLVKHVPVMMSPAPGDNGVLLHAHFLNHTHQLTEVSPSAYRNPGSRRRWFSGHSRGSDSLEKPLRQQQLYWDLEMRDRLLHPVLLTRPAEKQ